MNKPIGEETEYNLLNTLVQNDQDEVAIASRTAEISASNACWGICRCRMAAIIDLASQRHNWKSNQEYRALTVARYPLIAQWRGLASNRSHLTPLEGIGIPPGSRSSIVGHPNHF